MKETILNIYLIINKGIVDEFKAIAYSAEGDDEDKITFLKRNVVKDYEKAYHFDAPSDAKGKFIPYNKFAKLEKKGMHFELFEEIFKYFDVPERPLVCVTPVMDGKILSSEK